MSWDLTALLKEPRADPDVWAAPQTDPQGGAPVLTRCGLWAGLSVLASIRWMVKSRALRRL